MNMSPGILRHPKGTVLAREGDAAEKNMYILLQGEAETYKNYQAQGQVLVETIGQSGYFGEVPLLLNKPGPVTVVARSDVALMAINRKTALSIFSRQPELAFAIMEDMCRKLDAAAPSSIQPSVSPAAPAQAAAALKPSAPQQVKAPAPAAATPRKSSGSSALFPPGHGSYVLPINNDNPDYIYEDEITCPICGHKFKTMTVMVSRLRRESIDNDLRARYKNFEPLHYDVTSCPACLYSALTESFGSTSKKFSQRLEEELSPYRQGLSIKAGAERDTFTVFAGYYLALLCAPVCFDDYQLIRASLWQKLGRLYSDLGDSAMHQYAAKNALDEYIYSYQHFRISEKQAQQICYIIGDYYQKLGELDDARNYFFLAKTNREGSSMMMRQADMRLEEIKELKKSGTTNPA